VWAKVETLGLGSGDVVAQNASQSFDVSIWQIMSALVVGGRVEVIAGTGSRDGGRLLEAVAERGVTVLEVVPSQLRVMVAEAEEGCLEIPSLKWLYVMGEVFEPELYEKWRKRYPHVGVVNGYGPTECSDDVAQWTVGETRGARLPIGRPLSNLQVYVVNERGEAIKGTRDERGSDLCRTGGAERPGDGCTGPETEGCGMRTGNWSFWVGWTSR
jgi:non-ribosomal peptide synthetase component F